MIDITKTYRTRDGRAVRILATDVKSPRFPVIALVTYENGNQAAICFSSSGRYLIGDESDTEHKMDLIEVKPRIKRTVWLNVYPDTDKCSVYGFSLKSDADSVEALDRIACVKVEIDVEEGEGLG